MKRGIPEQEVTFRFGAMNQDEGDKHLRPGVMTLSQNTRQLKKNEWRKRRGNSRTAFAADIGSFIGGADTYVNAEGTRLARDSAGNNFSWDPTSGQFKNRGDITRPFTTSRPFMDSLSDPNYVVCGTNEWEFAIGSSVGASSAIRYVVRDTVTGRTVVSQQALAATDVTHISAVTDGTKLYVFWVSSAATIRLYTFVNATPAVAPTLTTYHNIPGIKFREVDAHCMASGEVFVVGISWVSGVSWHHAHSLLDKATGQVKGAPAPVVTTGAAVALGKDCCGGVSIANYDGANGSTYYTLWRPDGVGNILLKQCTVNLATLALTVNLTVKTSAVVTQANYAGTASYRDSNGDIVVFAHVNIDISGDGYDTSKCVTERYRVTPPATIVREADVGRSCWLAAKPFQVNGSWYLITGTTQTDTLTAAATANRNGYHIRNAVVANGSNGQVIAQIDFGLGPAIFHNRRFAVKAHSVDGDIVANRVAGVHSVYVSGSLASFGGVRDGAAVVYTSNFAETYQPGVVLGNKALFPGPIPYCMGKSDAMRELTPLMPPVPPSNATGPGPGTSVYVQALYMFRDADGKEDRGPVSALVGFAAVPTTIQIPTYRHWLANSQVFIEVYLTEAGATTPLKRFVTLSNPLADFVTVAPSAGFDTAVPPESIYTTGDALINEPPPPCRGLVVWRGRVIAYGTPDRGRIQPSQEMTGTSGPRWNAILSSFWADADSQILRMEPISWSDCALFTSSRVGVISGGGPDGKGGGAYIPQTLPEDIGIKNERAAVKGDKGCYFQASDSRYYLAQGAAPLVDVGGGVASFTSPVSAAVHDTAEAQVIFALQDGNFISLDYRRPTEEAPEGTWHHWTSSALTRAYGAIMIGGAYEMLETAGVRRAPQASFVDETSTTPADITELMQTGDMSPFGFGHAFRVDAVYVHGVFVAAATMSLLVEGDTGAATYVFSGHGQAFSAGPAVMRARPSGLGCVQAVRVRLTITGSGEGFVFNGVTLVVQDLGMMKFPNANQRF
jgi:hypothetical protein